MDDIDRMVQGTFDQIRRVCLSEAIRAIRNFMYSGCPADERPGLNRAMVILDKIRNKLKEDDKQ